MNSCPEQCAAIWEAQRNDSQPSRRQMTAHLSVLTLSHALESDDSSSEIVPIQGELPCQFQVQTGKLLDIILTLNSQSKAFTAAQKKKLRQSLGHRFYNRTRPGFYLRASSSLHIGYLGQPAGHGTSITGASFAVNRFSLILQPSLKARL